MIQTTNIEKVIKAIKKNKPILIKNFIDTSSFYKSEIKNLLNELEKNKNIAFNPLIKSYYKALDNYNFYKDTKKELLKEKNFVCDPQSRIWRHKKDNLTKFHYDGNGINVVNICLEGSKKFILTPPSSQVNIPFINLSLFNNNKKETTKEFIVEKNDLFLIPSFWYHEVLTLEDNTTTVNLCITDKKCDIDNNNLMKYRFHSLFRTAMIKEPIINVAKNKKITVYNFTKEYLKESILLILFISLCLILQQKTKINFNNIFLVLLRIITFFKGKESIGMLNVFSYNYSFLYMLLRKVSNVIIN
jgi:hypothetical protein